MFKKIWKTPSVMNPILDKVQKEINKSVLRSRNDHNNPNIWLKVKVAQEDNLPHIYVTEDEGKIYEDLLFSDLVKDEAVQKQVQALPSFLKSLINFDKIITIVNNAVAQSLGSNQYAKVTHGDETANIDLYSNEKKIESNISLRDLIDVTKL